jgi:hypothetical protein
MTTLCPGQPLPHQWLTLTLHTCAKKERARVRHLLLHTTPPELSTV